MPTPKRPPPDTERLEKARASVAHLPKLSERMIEFAEPLLAPLASPPPVAALRGVMTIATIAWNLPMFERAGDPKAPSFRAGLDAAVRRGPPEARRLVDELLAARLTKYADDPRLAVVEVRSGEGGEAQVVAKTMLPDEGM